MTLSSAKALSLLFLSFLAFCSQNQDKHQIARSDNFVIGSFTVEGLEANNSPDQFATFLENSDDYLTYFAKDSVRYYQLSANNSRDDGAISLSNIPDDIRGYFPVNKDSIYAIIGDRKIVLFNSRGLVTDSIVVRINSETFDSKLVYLDAFYEYPLLIDSRYLYVFHFTNLPLINEERTNRYYEGTIELLVSKSDSSRILKVGKYPEHYLSRKYYVYSPSRTINYSDLIIYSFASSDDLIIYRISENSYTTVTVSSNFFEMNESFALDNINDYDYISRYLTTNSRYGKVVYDKFKNLVYRVCHHATEYEREDGTVNLWIDKPWSLLILDEKFEVLKEVTFPGRTYDFRNILVTSFGVIVARKPTMPKSANIDFDVFKFD